MITSVRGTEDKLDLKLYNFILNAIKQHMAVYNFSEIETPILEHTELFVRAVGEQTDVVSKEMYIFNTASGESICLRPEGTASVIRAYVENRVEQAPWKVYLHGPMFRHERPQKGRWRQFTQTSMEIINTQSIAHDAYVIKLLDALFTDVFKLELYVLKINFLGCSNDRKDHRDALLNFLNTHASNICQTCIVRKDKNTLRVFDCKSETCLALYTGAPKITEHLCTSCSEEWAQLQQLLQILAINYIIDPTLVRGLDYYNKTVFEFASRELGAQNAFCGGGRYSLGKDVGAKDDIPCIGAAIGMGRLLMLIEKNIQKLSIPQDTALHVIIPFSHQQVPLALMVAYQLQSHNLISDVLCEKASISNLMKKANKMAAKYALIIGPDEQAQGVVAVKNMHKGETTTVKQADIIQFLRNH